MILVKLLNSYMLSQLTLRISEIKRTKMVGVVGDYLLQVITLLLIDVCLWVWLGTLILCESHCLSVGVVGD